MTRTPPALGVGPCVALRLLVAALVLVAQILGAAIGAAAMGGAAAAELCGGTTGLAPPAPDEDSPKAAHHQPCPACFAGPGMTALPSVAATAPVPPIATDRPGPDLGGPPPPLARTLRPPGRAPPIRS